MRSGFLGGGIGPRAFGGGGLADPVPVPGAELIVNRTMNDASWWSTVDADWIISGGVATHTTAGSTGAVARNLIMTSGSWYQSIFDVADTTTGRVRHDALNISAGYTQPVQNGTMLITDRATSTYIAYRAYLGFDGSFDNPSLKLLPLSSLLSTRAYASADCDLSAAVTRTAGTQAGLCARLDSATSPANFIIAYLDGAGNVKADKCVGGTYTNIISGAVTYAAGRVLRLVCAGNDVSCYYNGVQVGSTQTVSDAGIVSNVRHGKFSTYASNTLANYVAA